MKAKDEASRALRSFSKDVRMVGDSVEQANLQAAKSALRNHLAMQRMTGASKQDQIATMQRIAAIDQEIGQARVHRASMEESRVSAQKLGTALGGASAAMTAAGTGMVAAGVIGAVGLKHLVDAAIEYQKQSALTHTQTDKFSVSLKAVGDIGLRVANQIGVPFKQIQPALFDIFSSMEIGAKDAEKMLTTFAKAAVAGNTDITSASRATIGIMNAFQLPMTSVNHLMDVQFQLVKEGIGTYEEWTQRIGLVSPSAVRAGQSVEMMAAALAASTRMGISAARSGTAVARAMDAMSNPKAVAALKTLGVNAVDATGHFRPMIDVLMEFRAKLEKIPPADRIKAILDVFKGAGGTIEARRFLQNMLLTPGNLELFKKIFETMSTESGSFEQAYSVMADTAAAKSELLTNKWETLKVKAGEALIPMFLKVVDVLGKVFDWFNKLPPSTQQTIMTILAIGTAVGIFGGALVIVLGFIVAFAAAAATAGATLWIVLGILGGVALAIAAFAAALVLAWKNSEQFRGIIQDTKKNLEDLWKNAIVPTGEAIKKAWDEHMKPALNKLHDVIETKVLPVFRRLQNFAQQEMVKAAIELGNNIKDVLVWALKELGKIIENVVVPALEKLGKFYKDHETTIKQVIAALIWLAKWGIKIGLIFGGIIAVIFAGPVVASVLAVVAVFLGVIAVIILIIEAAKWLIHWFGTAIPAAWHWLVDVAKKTWQAISDFFVGIWNGIVNFLTTTWNGIVSTAKSTWQAISDFFVGLWNGIVDFFTGVWNHIVDIFNSVMSTISSAWDSFWNSSIGGLLKAIWGLIVSIVNLGIASIMFVVLWGLKFITDIWNWAWNGIKDAAIAVWNFIFPYLKAAWDGIVAVAVIIWTGLVTFFVGIWNWIQNTATTFWNWLSPYLIGTWNWIVAAATNIWNGLVNFFVGVWNWIKNTAIGVWNAITGFLSGVWNGIIATGKSAWNGFASFFTNIWNNIRTAVSNVWKDITGFFSGAGTWLLKAGGNIIQGLIDGITGGIRGLGGAIDNVTKYIKDHFPHSPAKRGPLSGRGGMFYAGQNLMTQLEDGINSKIGIIAHITGLAANAAGNIAPSLTPGASTGNTINQSITINTQEINPRRQAAELGWLLSGRI